MQSWDSGLAATRMPELVVCRQAEQRRGREQTAVHPENHISFIPTKIFANKDRPHRLECCTRSQRRSLPFGVAEEERFVRGFVRPRPCNRSILPIWVFSNGNKIVFLHASASENDQSVLIGVGYAGSELNYSEIARFAKRSGREPVYGVGVGRDFRK